MKLKYIITIVALIMIIVIFIMLSYSSAYFDNDINNSTFKNNTSTAIPNTLDNNITLPIPSNDYVINNINWSKYPNLQKGYISVAEISGPNNVVKHEFIEVQIHTEIINSNNKTEILKQLDSVARDARTIYGPNSGINIYGDVNGIPYYFSSMIPYDDGIY